MIAVSLPIHVAIGFLAGGVIVNAWGLWRANKRELKLMRRVHELELERDFPGWTERKRFAEEHVETPWGPDHPDYDEMGQ